jgi:hypothetical protein
MNLSLSRVGILVGVVGLVTGLVLAARRAERLWPVEEIAGTERLAVDMEKQREEILDRLEQKRDIARKVIAGELTLLDAAHRYQVINESGPHFYWEGFRVYHDGDTDEERHCREVADRVEGELVATDPCLGLALRARLLTELEKWKAKNKSKQGQ